MIDLSRLEAIGVNMDELTVVDKDYHAWQRERGEWVPAPMPTGHIFGAGSITGKPRILLFTPAHPRYGIRPQTRDSIHEAIRNYSGAVDWFITHGDNPLDKPYSNVVRHHNRAREMVLGGDYDALLSIEADMIVPPDTIDALLACDADISYGLYVWRNKPRRWSAYKELGLFGGYSISHEPDGEEARAAWGKIVDVVGLGMGCTLIKRHVLQDIEFRLHDGRHSWIQEVYAEEYKALGLNPYREHKDMVADDWLLAMDAQHYGFTQRANLGVVCGHIADDGIYWPDPEAGPLYRIEKE